MYTGSEKAFSATFSLAKSVEETFSKEPFPGTMNLETAAPLSRKVVFFYVLLPCRFFYIKIYANNVIVKLR
jgi:hypothetical protein